jgi:hypothetical protein
MIRKLFAALAVAALLVVPAEAKGKRAIRIFTPVEKVAHAELVVTGKVASFDKDAMLVQYAGDPNKVAHKVAVIKIEKGLLGAGKMTEVKVAFVAPPKPDPNAPPVRPGRPGRGGFQQIDLKEGQQATFFLTRHVGGDYYAISPMLAPIDSKDENAKAAAEVVAKAAAAVADPVKALKAEKAEERFLAATAVISKYRSFPQDGRETTTEKVPAEESKLLLQALAEGDWSKYDQNTVNGSQVFYSLGLTEKDGWVQPVVVNNPGAPPVDFNAVMKDAFAQWLKGAGKNYQISKNVPKK